MKAYLITTGIIFGLLTGLHIWRAIAETAKDPVFILLIGLPALLCFWAWRLLRTLSRS